MFLRDNLKEASTASGLVNAVLAQGCRLVLGRKTYDSGLAIKEARKYYNASLTAKSRLIGIPPSILTIQVRKLLPLLMM